MKLQLGTGASVMDAELYIPEGAVGAPSVVLCPGLTRDLAGIDFLRQAFNDAGFAVLAIRYRGMELLEDDDDVRAAIDFVAEHPDLDHDRIGLVGHSRGSMVSLRTAAIDKRVKTVVAIHPVTDFLGYVRACRDFAPRRYEALLGRFGNADPAINTEPYDRYAALNYADRIEVPVLLIAGTTDLHSPMHHSELMYDALQAAGNENAKLEIIEGSGHFFERYYLDDCRDETAGLSVDWLKATLS